MMDLQPAEDDIRRNRILDRATQQFLAYGYKRVTMDDIARAADMSRPALYLVFRNKADIYSAIGERMFEASIARAEMAVAESGPLGDRLFAAMDSAMFAVMEEIIVSPHGAELLDLKNELAAVNLDHWRQRAVTIFTAAIAAETDRTGVDLDARGLTAGGLSEMLLDGIEGTKSRSCDLAELRAAARRLVRVIELALQP